MLRKNKLIKPQTLKGFRDFLPEEMVIRQKVIDILRGVFESYGYEPLETPSLEYASTLLGKYGEEADKLVYTFKDQGERDVGLIYDLTVPASRLLSLYSQKIPLPFRRYQIQRIWRAEKPQKGRYREVLQCDFDIFGSSSPLADAEIIAIIYECLRKLKFKKFTIKINSRQTLFNLMKKANVPKEKVMPTIRAIDKLDKIDQEKVEKVISQILDTKTAKKIFTLINQTKPDDYLNEVFKALQLNSTEGRSAAGGKVPKDFWKFDPTLARGLDYYTGPVFETYIEKPKNLSADWRIGSITGGGRYDELISKLGGPDIPATGSTIGLDRICDVIKEQNLWPDIKLTKTQVLVTIFSPEYVEKSIEVATTLRFSNVVNTELYPDPNFKLDKQLKYADKKGIPLVVILGPEETKENKVTIKDLKTGKQESVPQSELKTYFNQLK